MALTINTNVTALMAQRNLGISSARSQSSLSKLSSGQRITTAKDDAASLSIANGLKLDLASLRAASANITQATSMLQIADGGLAQITDVLGRMQTLASTAQSDQISDTERSFLNTEYQNLVNEITRIAESTEYNGVELLSGSTGVNAALGVNTVGANIDNDNGFVSYSLDSNVLADTEAFTVEYDKDTNVMTVTHLDATGGNIVGSQSLDLNDFLDTGTFSTAASSGQTVSLNFADVGVQLTLAGGNTANGAFDVATDIAANNEVVVNEDAAGVQGTSLSFKVGIAATDVIAANVNGATAAQLNLNTTGVGTTTNANAAVTAIQTAMDGLNTNRANLGATMSRLEFAGANVAIQVENTESARSTLMDTDVASEMTQFTSQQVLVQAGVSMLAQANQQPSLLLRLLQ